MKSNKLLLIIFAFNLVAASCSTIGTQQDYPVPPRVLETNNEFEVIWNLSNINVNNNNRRSMMVGSPGKIIIEV